MTPSILVLTDFFAVTNRALSYVAGLAVPLKANLMLLHVRHDDLLAPAEFGSRHTAAGEQKTRYALEQLAADQPVTTEVGISESSLTVAVHEAMQQRPPLMLVLGRPGADAQPPEPGNRYGHGPAAPHALPAAGGAHRRLGRLSDPPPAAGRGR